jgi:CBS domain-containing protein
MSIPEAQLAHVRVHDVMHTGILTTDPSTPLRVVARLMSEQQIHAVAVADPDYARRPWAIVTTLDVAAAAAGGSDDTAGQAAAGKEIVTVSSADWLDCAAGIMVERRVEHLIVIDPATGHPAGILSSLDVAAAYAD